MSVTDLRELEARYVMPTYARTAVEFVRGDGALLWDADGKQYLDFLAGISVHNAGHSHAEIAEEISRQLRTLGGVSNLFYTEPAMKLCERLVERSLGGKAFLANSGAEANECAIKLVRKRAHLNGIDSPEIVVLEGAFHGRTLATIAATPKLAREDLFGPLPQGFVAVPRDDPDAMRGAVGERTAAVMLEPIQGEAGVFPIAEEVLLAARESCDTQGAVLVFDEIQTGMGRTGSLWAYEQLAVRPDVITTGKALGGGLPVSACVATEELGDVLQRGDHASTFAGAPIAATAGLASLDVLDDAELLRVVRERGVRFMAGLEALEGVAEVRGRGLMVGVTLGEGLDSADVAARALGAGLVVNVPGPGLLRFLPPLVVTDAQIGEALGILAEALSAVRV